MYSPKSSDIASVLFLLLIEKGRINIFWSGAWWFHLLHSAVLCFGTVLSTVTMLLLYPDGKAC